MQMASPVCGWIGGALYHGGPFLYLPHLDMGGLPSELGGSTAGLALQAGMSRNHVATTAVTELSDVDAGHAIPMVGMQSMAVVAMQAVASALLPALGLR